MSFYIETQVVCLNWSNIVNTKNISPCSPLSPATWTRRNWTTMKSTIFTWSLKECDLCWRLSGLRSGTHGHTKFVDVTQMDNVDFWLIGRDLCLCLCAFRCCSGVCGTWSECTSLRWSTLRWRSSVQDDNWSLRRLKATRLTQTSKRWSTTWMWWVTS